MNLLNLFADLFNKEPPRRPVQKGTPASVLNGCRRQHVIVEGARGSVYSIPVKRWKAMVRAEERKARGRYVGPFDFPTKGA